MKKIVTLSMVLSCLAFLCSCEKTDYDDSLLPKTRSESKIISKSDFLSQVKGVYYREECAFLCSDSLGQTCYWDVEGNSTLEMPSLSDFSYNFWIALSGHSSSLVTFDNTCEYIYTSRANLSMMDFYTIRMYWFYDECTGSLATWPKAFPKDYSIEDPQQCNKLVRADKDYLIIRQETPYFHTHGNAQYSYLIYKSVDKETAEAHWYLDAEIAMKEF